ncbi:FAD-dependent oxidoreductase [Paenibacillus roseipurpureus]|uniref:FAD-dependent oxidoreductase n=1 Tax=Paenibacillus roseopurpureus TaxID=2918901 RepID=A0AA96LPI8_9BACL|nr:FAD-dependent oxidoreductase [Paenibacillus sp. MBLB1832]WNR43453.1 FAD-dependent oxidoreductase [Paenibacillus sp. MBLB1832]
MNVNENEQYDIVIVGAGVGGICAALAAGRLFQRVLLVEQNEGVGGTGVYSSVSLVCRFRALDGRPINNGIHRELFPEAYSHFSEERVPTYDEFELKSTYERLLAKESYITVWTSSCLLKVDVKEGAVRSVEIARDGNPVLVSAAVFLDATADGNLSALAGAEYQKGRREDGRMQSATATFRVSGFHSELLKDPNIHTWNGIRSLRMELLPYYQKMKEEGRTQNPRPAITCFPYPDGNSILFNSTAVVGVDPTDPETVAHGMEEGTRQARELFEAISQHPAFAAAKLDYVAPKLGVREGRRIIGEYEISAEDCLNAQKFDDMVAACAYEIDLHNPLGGAASLVRIPDPGYYHIPYRSLIPIGICNLLLSSRCISGSYEAHGSYRVMSGVSAIGEAAGIAAALYCFQGKEDVREVKASHIRYVQQLRGQFVEGEVEPFPLPLK